MHPAFDDLWDGDWRQAPKSCGGNVEVWDQTIGCPECGMNLWFLPEPGHWPEWMFEHDEPPADWWKNHGDKNPYEPYFRIFDKIHPFTFNDCHDPGDVH